VSRLVDNRSVRVVVFLLPLLIVVALLAGGCTRESPSGEPPIHLVPDMDQQPKYKPQSESEFFANGSAMRQPVEGTVARGYLREGDTYFSGRDEAGDFISEIPIERSVEVLRRGEERFNIYCAPCHGTGGTGNGSVVARGFTQPPDFISDSSRQMLVGQMYDAVTNGVRNMPSYRHQIRPEDRWAIIMHLRNLQRVAIPQAGTKDE